MTFVLGRILEAKLNAAPAVVTPSSCPLRAFVEGGWHVVEPARPFVPNWHIDAITEHLEAAARADITRLVISIPPGHAKSLIVAVMWPAWIWTWNPHWRSIFGSHDARLSLRDGVRARTVMDSDWYEKEFSPTWDFTSDQNVKGYYRNTKMGERLSISVGTGTGFRGDAVVVDDPVNVADRFSAAKLDEVKDWWDTSMSNRFNDQAKGVRVIIAQRTVVGDLTGHVLSQGGYEHLCLPSEFDVKRRCVTSLGVADPRTEDGDLLFPTLFPEAVIEQAKKDLGSIDFSAQHQQLPVPLSGGVFQREWFQGHFYTKLPPVYDEVIVSWDMSFKDTKSSDFVVGQVWARLGADCYLLHERRGRMNYPATRRAVKDVSSSFPLALLKLVEDKANGPAIVDDLRTEVPGLVPVTPEGSKEARAWAVTPMCEAGNVHLPDPSIWPEVEEWLAEVCTFPKGVKDDRVDSFTQALIRFKRNIDRNRRPEPAESEGMSEAASVASGRY